MIKEEQPRIAEQLGLVTARRRPPFAFKTVAEFTEALDRKKGFDYGQDNLYFRDGFPALHDLEERCAELIGADEKHVVMTNSGMSAATTVLEIASLTAGDTVVYGSCGYSQVVGYISEDLKERGVASVAVNPGSTQEIEDALSKYKPKVLFLDTIGNGPGMPALNVDKFLKLQILKELDCLIILDNTLTTSSVLPLAKLIEESDLRIVGVESATKSYALNKEIAGLVVASNDQILERVQKKRRRIGSTPGPSAVATLQAKLPSRDQFDLENRLIAWNTLLLAQACYQAPGSDEKFFVTHPNLADHPNSEYANRIYPYGAAPVFFIQPDWGPSAPTPQKIAEEIEKAFGRYGLSHVQNNEDYYLAQSFAFDKIGISFDNDRNYVRIAGGLENPDRIRLLQQALQEGLARV